MKKNTAFVSLPTRNRGIIPVPSIDEIAGLINRNLLLSGKKGM
jgi:hypothetical protein